MTVTSALTSTYEEKPPLEAPKNKANSKPIGKKTATHHAASFASASFVFSLGLWPGFLRHRQPARTKQHLLCKTKPIYQPLLMNLTSALTSTYEHKPPLEAPKNKANFNPCSCILSLASDTVAKLCENRGQRVDKSSSLREQIGGLHI